MNRDEKDPAAHEFATTNWNIGLMVATAVMLFTASSIFAVRIMQQNLEKVFAANHRGAHADPANQNATATAVAFTVAAPGTTRADPVRGKAFFNMSCFICHGPTGNGVPGQGPTLRLSAFVATRSDEQLAAFIKVGRQPGDRNSVLNLTMPAMGGNPTLDDEGLRDVVSFIRTLR